MKPRGRRRATPPNEADPPQRSWLELYRTDTRRIARSLSDTLLAPLLAPLHPLAVPVWRRLGACSILPALIRGRCAPLEDWFWDHPYLMRDVLAIRGAAMVVRSFMETYDDPEMTAAWDRLQSGDWLAVCSAQSTAYRALRVTLSNCPGRLPMRELRLLDLRGVQLPRPRRTRLELIAAMAVGRHLLAHGNRQHADLILTANHDQLAAALPRHREDLFDHVALVSATQQAYVITDLMDYPDPCPDLATLGRRSAAWHAAGGAPTRLRHLLPSLQDPQTPTAEPPCRWPGEDDGSITVRRLTTVGEVLAEGAAMNHCVATYAAKAAAGLCFLYHIELDGNPATVELDPRFRLVQVRGPDNRSNRASHYIDAHAHRWASEAQLGSCAPC